MKRRISTQPSKDAQIFDIIEYLGTQHVMAYELLISLFPQILNPVWEGQSFDLEAMEVNDIWLDNLKRQIDRLPYIQFDAYGAYELVNRFGFSEQIMK